jgi:ferric-chelate reductase (NADPH)
VIRGSDVDISVDRREPLTPPADGPQKSAPSAPTGRFRRMLSQWLMRSVRVATVETLSSHFRLVDLEGEALKGVAWMAGQKVQVSMGSGLTTRTYTPMSWDADRGRTRLLTFAHGDGPGRRWASGLREGDTCQFFGPRRSLDLSGLESPAVLFGDETSFGLVVALCDSPQGAVQSPVFEASDVGESRSVLEAIGLSQARLVERSADTPISPRLKRRCCARPQAARISF